MTTILKELKDFIKFKSYNQIKNDLTDKKIKVTENSMLYMVNFKDDADFTDPIVRQSNGVILEKNTNKIVHYSFDKCYEVHEDSLDKVDLVEFNKGVVYDIEPYNEGCLIKIYHYNDKWNISTSKKIDASKNFWVKNHSFEQLLTECKYFDINNLDTNYCYTYILQHPKLLLTNNYDDVRISLITKALIGINNEIELYDMIDNSDNDFIKIESIDQLDISNNNYMIIYKDHTRVKVLNDSYVRVKNIMSKYSNLDLIYFDNINNKHNRDLIINMYPDFNYKQLDHIFEIVCNNIYNIYVDKFIYKQKIEIPTYYNKTIYQLHNTYKARRTPIHLGDVINILGSLSGKTLAYIMNYKY